MQLSLLRDYRGIGRPTSRGRGVVAYRTGVRYPARVSDTRAATISALRTRLAALGGTGPDRTVARRRVRTAAERAADLGFSVEATELGEVFVRRLRVELDDALERSGLDSIPPLGDLLALLGHPVEAAEPPWGGAEGIGVLDIETLGLHGSGVVAFLVATGVQRGGVLDAEQHLLVDPGGEAAMLGAIAARIAAHRLWLTYNGRSFDIPVLSARCIVNRLDAAVMQPRIHGDLLAPMRRLFRDRLGACTLRHAEMSILNHHRVDDVPGSEAPSRYRAWLRGAPAAVLSGVVDHNLQDIVSTVVASARLAAHVGGERVRPPHAADGYHLAVHLERRGVADAAEVELRATIAAGVEPWARRAGHRLAIALQRQDRTVEALDLWARLHAADARDVRAARGYAIRLERAGRLGDALEVCRTVARVRAELGPRWVHQWGGGLAGDREWSHREQRLRRRLRA